MSLENDLKLSRLAVRLDDFENGLPIGSGVLVNVHNNSESVYLLTAAHCLYENSQKLLNPRSEVSVQIFDRLSATYQAIVVTINHRLVSKSQAKDVAIIKLDKSLVESIAGPIPALQAIKERNSITSFVLKGFPSATRGQEIVLTKPIFVQESSDKLGFQLRLTDDFTTDTSAESKVDGFSGSGVFLESYDRIYLFGIFTRFREAQKIIYCQYIEVANELLSAAFLPTIPFSYVGDHGLTPEFFERQNSDSIKNLGPRFTERLNLHLPIIGNFHDAAKNEVFKYRLSQCVNRWLEIRNYSRSEQKESVITKIAGELDLLKKYTSSWLLTINWEADKQIDLASLKTELDGFKNAVVEKKEELYTLQQLEREKGREQEEGSMGKHSRERQPYESDLSWLRNTEQSIYVFEKALDEISITVANSPVLIIKGDPGCGKSHLLGDMANKGTKTGVATLLLLGQLFQRNQTIAQNILGQLGLNCSQNELFTSLNNIGRQQGSRVLLMIDALNEGPGKDLWKDALPGFIEEIKRYPFVGLVMTIRSTYFNAIISQNLQTDQLITYRVHEGFKGNEYAALRLFCEYYGLQMPTFPILTPEFTNPLFLQLICQGVKLSGRNTFPQGFQGVSTVFNYYLDAVYDKLKEKRDDYENRRHIVREAIYIVAKTCFESKHSRMLPVENADKLFENTFPRFPHLLNDLIHENVFIQTTRQKYESETEFEMITFAYERFGDFFIAEQLLDQYATADEVSQAFQKNNDLGKLLEGYIWPNRGVLDAMAVHLPEKYGLEIMGVCEWAFGEKEDFQYSDVDEWLSRSFWDSLIWRKPASIDNEKITAWLNGDQCRLNEDEYLFRLIELTTVPDHPFNSDRLFKYLFKFSMADRDAFWQAHMFYYSRFDDDKNAFPIRRLIDWAWQKGVSSLVDVETARLAAQTLTWLLSSTYRQLRDQVTKAMVNLLEEQPDALIKVMEAFKDIDDAYISERLCAVAYGCALRTSIDKNLSKIAQYVYQNVFQDKNPPVNVLLRDYARNIIEYADYKEVTDNVDMALARPPYNSHFPVLPSKEDVRQYRNGSVDTDNSWEKEKSRMYGQIHFSTVSWDFGRYTVESAIRSFESYSFKTEVQFKDFQKSLRGKRKYIIKCLISSLKLKITLQEEKTRGVKTIPESFIDEWIVEEDEHFQQCLTRIEELFSDSELVEIHQKFLPFLRVKNAKSSGLKNFEDVDSVKYWIVQRAFELGYDIEKHFDYDRITERLNEKPDIHGGQVERIGKKYQWIALHEIIARLCDNYYYSDRWSSNAKNGIYQGPWQNYIRDVDPVFITKSSDVAISEELGNTGVSVPKGWWFDEEYKYWDQPITLWVKNKQDLPAPEKLILRRDEHSEDWVYLKMNATWKEPKAISPDRYDNRKEIWYGINAYFVRKRDKKKVIEWLTGKNFFGRWMPEPGNTSLGLFNRENYWSPIAMFDCKQRDAWQKIPDTAHRVLLTTGQAVGEMSEDKSEAHFYYDMPSKTLFEGLGLCYASEDGSFANSEGQIVVINKDPYGILVRRTELSVFLKNNDYDILWTLLGEKNALTGITTNSDTFFKAISGVYQLDGNKIIGDFSIFERT